MLITATDTVSPNSSAGAGAPSAAICPHRVHAALFRCALCALWVQAFWCVCILLACTSLLVTATIAGVVCAVIAS